MLSIKLPSKYNQNVGLNYLLIRYGSGQSLKDKFLFFILKMSYLGLRGKSRLIAGKENRKNILSKIEFKDLMAKFVGKDNMIVCEVPKYGYKSYCRTWNYFNDLVIMTTHEDDMLQLFNPSEGDIVVDVGAYLGRYTLTSSRRVGEDGKVIAIEADRSHYEMLNKNIKLNKMPNVRAINCMVGSQDTHITYQELLGKDLHESELMQFGNNKIHVNSLDNLLIKERGINKVNWIKIDVEGAELEVLKGAHNILTNSKRIKLQIEIHGISHLYKPIVELLNLYNFKITFEKDEPNYKSGDRIGAKQIIAEKF
jgi:FkbM family methyltransferase